MFSNSISMQFFFFNFQVSTLGAEFLKRYFPQNHNVGITAFDSSK